MSKPVVGDRERTELADVFQVVCGMCIVSRRMTGGLSVGRRWGSATGAQSLEGKKYVCVEIRCWNWRETEKPEVASFFLAGCGVWILRWEKSRRPYMNRDR